MYRVSLFLLLSCLAACEATPEPQWPISEEVMATYMGNSQPGTRHQALDKLIGEWDCNMTFWFYPGAAPLRQSDVSCTTRWILSGRFQQSDCRGIFMGQPWEGLGLMGYDTHRGVYEGTWMDSLGIYMAPLSSGEANEDDSIITFYRQSFDPMQKMHYRMREVLTFVDADHHTYEQFATYPNTPEYQMMRIDYTRASSAQ